MSWSIICADALEALRGMDADSLDSLVTDPPAGIAFMGKDWDGDKGGRDPWVAWLASIMREALRVLKPGAHGLVWALPRTSHWTATALENAGFEIRDVITHLFGTGFPKSQNISKQIDKQLNAEREVVAYRRQRANSVNSSVPMNASIADAEPITIPATAAAAAWDGWGTALKPASEHYILIRKPLSEKSIAANVLKQGTGGINIDGCRIPHSNASDFAKHKQMVDRIKSNGGVMGDSWKNSSDLSGANEVNGAGRWPANVVLSHTFFCGDECVPDCAVKLLDQQGGMRQSGKPAGKRNVTGYSGGLGDGKTDLTGYGDSGGASRFFFIAKPSTAEKQEALTTLSLFDSATDKPQRNIHPTVKPIALMEYFIRLITPPSGKVLDPFGGSGTTGAAAVRLGFDCIIIERDPDYAAIAKARIERASLESAA